MLITDPVHVNQVLDMSEVAAQAGVRPGLSLYQAQHMCPEALVLKADELTYHARHSQIEAALRAFTPAVETQALGEFYLDVRGLEALHGTGPRLTRVLREAAEAASGLDIRVGLAAGKFTAEQVARSGLGVVPPGGETYFLASLPIAVLPHLPGEVERRLRLLGLQTLGDLAGLSRTAVLRQFGPEFAGWHDLARGQDARPVNPEGPPLRLVRSLRLTESLSDRLRLLQVVQRVSGQLSQSLTAKGYHAEALKLTLDTEAGLPVELAAALKPPTSDSDRLRRLAAQLLGRAQLTRPVQGVAVSAYPLRAWYLGAQQMALTTVTRSDRQLRLEEVLRLLSQRFGEAMLRLATLLGPPTPLSIQVAAGPDGLPQRLSYAGSVRAVQDLDEYWREERFWWDRPVQRECYRVVLTDGSLRNIFRDRLTGEWYLDRSWPLL